MTPPLRLCALLLSMMAGCAAPEVSPRAAEALAPVVPVPPLPHPVAPPDPDGWELVFMDNFEGVQGAPPGFGLNEGLEQRQSGTLGRSTYSIRAGDWVDGSEPMPGTCHVGDAEAGAGRLSIHGIEGRPYGAAVQLDRPLPIGSDEGLRVSVRFDPVIRDQESLGWASVMLIPEPGAAGWPTRSENLLGVLVRSNGELQVLSRGHEVEERFEGALPGPAESYSLELRVHLVREGQQPALVLDGSFQGVRFSAALEQGPGAALPERVFLYLGTHFHLEMCPSRATWFDDLRIESFSPIRRD